MKICLFHWWVIFIFWLIVCRLTRWNKCSFNYAPACDIITYHHLRKLTIPISSLQSCSARYCCHPRNLSLVVALWKIFWFPRKGVPRLPSHFSQIAFSTWIEKFFIRLWHLVSYLVKNKIFDSSTQKGFLTSIMENILSVNAMIQSAKDCRQPHVVTFIDLRNAFGSILDTLMLAMYFMSNPSRELLIHQDPYLSPETFIHTKDWITPKMQVSIGIFLGDALFPIPFLLAFNPIIQLAK